jgi:hypothetical protein
MSSFASWWNILALISTRILLFLPLSFRKRGKVYGRLGELPYISLNRGTARHTNILNIPARTLLFHFDNSLLATNRKSPYEILPRF